MKNGNPSFASSLPSPPPCTTAVIVANRRLRHSCVDSGPSHRHLEPLSPTRPPDCVSLCQHGSATTVQATQAWWAVTDCTSGRATPPNPRRLVHSAVLDPPGRRRQARPTKSVTHIMRRELCHTSSSLCILAHHAGVHSIFSTWAARMISAARDGTTALPRARIPALDPIGSI